MNARRRTLHNAAVPEARLLKVGVVNLMPRAERYESVLAGCMEPTCAELFWIRLESHVYSSSNREHLARYWTYSRLRDNVELDALVITGAPVDGLRFEHIKYWDELSGVLRHAETHSASVLGICWGALALAHYLGVATRVYSQKLFGVFSARHRSDHPLVRSLDEEFACPHSRLAGLDAASLAAAVGNDRIRVLAESRDIGPVLLASPDARCVMHLGHPEYPTQRLLEEYLRDRDAGQAVATPRNYDLDAPRNTWRTNGLRFFAAWLDWVGARGRT